MRERREKRGVREVVLRDKRTHKDFRVDPPSASRFLLVNGRGFPHPCPPRKKLRLVSWTTTPTPDKKSGESGGPHQPQGSFCLGVLPHCTAIKLLSGGARTDFETRRRETPVPPQYEGGPGNQSIDGSENGFVFPFMGTKRPSKHKSKEPEGDDGLFIYMGATHTQISTPYPKGEAEKLVGVVLRDPRLDLPLGRCHNGSPGPMPCPARVRGVFLRSLPRLMRHLNALRPMCSGLVH